MSAHISARHADTASASFAPREPVVTCKMVGFEFEVTIDTPLAVMTTGARWAGEPLTAEAAGALLRLLGAGVTSASVAPDGALHLVIGEAAIEVWPNDYYESWQLRGPRNLRVCSPGGEYIAVFEPDGEA